MAVEVLVISLSFKRVLNDLLAGIRGFRLVDFLDVVGRADSLVIGLNPKTTSAVIVRKEVFLSTIIG